MGVGPWTDGSQPAEPPEQPTKWKYGFGCVIGGVLLVALATALALLIRVAAPFLARVRPDGRRAALGRHSIVR